MNKTPIAVGLLWLLASVASAKLPPPSDEAKTKAAEAAAKTAWAGKKEAFLLCKSQERVVAHYLKTAKPAGKTAGAGPSSCTDVEPFVWPVVAVAGPAGTAPAAAPAPAPVKAAEPAAKPAATPVATPPPKAASPVAAKPAPAPPKPAAAPPAPAPAATPAAAAEPVAAPPAPPVPAAPAAAPATPPPTPASDGKS